MKRSHLLAALSCLLLQACTTVPQALHPPPGERLLATWRAEGRWVYHCRLSNDGKEMAWASLRPEAVLRDETGRTVGRIEAGPNLVHGDGSVAELSVRETSPALAALPLALYAAQPAGATGVLRGVSNVQQLRTSGGAQPIDGCTSGDHLMVERAVPFSAELRLFGR